MFYLPDRMTEWVEHPSPILGDQRFEPHPFEPWSSQRNGLKIDTRHNLALLGLGKEQWNEEDQSSIIDNISFLIN